MHEVRMYKMTNSEKYCNNWCRTCAFAAAAETLTECNLQHTCVLCACYSRETQRCHCYDEAGENYTCKYYKENGR